MTQKRYSYFEFGKNLYSENDTLLAGVNEFGQHFLHFLSSLNNIWKRKCPQILFRDYEFREIRRLKVKLYFGA